MDFEGVSLDNSHTSSEGKGTSIADLTDPEVPVYRGEEGIAISGETMPGDASVSEAWRVEKQTVSLLDPIKNVVDHVKIFFASRAIDTANKKYDTLFLQATKLYGQAEEIHTRIDNSKKAEKAITAIRKASGLGGASKETQSIRDAQIKSAQARVAGIDKSIDSIDDRRGIIKERRTAFEATRSEAKERIIGRFQAKVDREQATISRLDTNVTEVTGKLEGCSTEIATLQEHRALLQEQMVQSVLPEFAREMHKTDELLAFKIHQAERMKALHEKQRAVLIQKKSVAEQRKGEWEKKIAPPKPKGDREPIVSPAPLEAVQEEVSQEDVPGEALVEQEAPVDAIAIPEAQDVPVDAVEEATTPAQEAPQGKVIETVGATEESSERRPANLIDTVLGFKKEVNQMEEEEAEDLGRLLQGAKNVYERKYPDSKVFTWIFWILDFFAESKESSKK